MIRFLVVARVATLTTILLILLSHWQQVVAALANRIIVIPPQIAGF